VVGHQDMGVDLNRVDLGTLRKNIKYRRGFLCTESRLIVNSQRRVAQSLISAITK
jgi:hypothetical protein